MRNLVLFAVIVVAGTGGELCISRAMKNVGEATSFHPAAIARVVLRALCEPWMWAGVTMMACAFFALLGALHAHNVSFVVPVTALSYVAGALGGAVFLREHVSRRRWIGVLLVAIGVTLVVFGKK
ncbi:MAG: EamA family transporter [Acidobacteriaceae bacterium]|nr:EamA family transporter [Acidobacteriaceae bacterium]